MNTTISKTRSVEQSMTRYLVATRSIHTMAAACDYLTQELSAEDAVTVLTVDSPDDTRDGDDAYNVANARLSGIAVVELEIRDGEPGPEILAAVDACAADRLVLGSRGGESGRPKRIGETTRFLLKHASIPVIVVPVTPPD